MTDRIGIFYGSTTGNTEAVAALIRSGFGEDAADMMNVDVAEVKDIENYKFLVFGVSTWGISDLQDDFEDFLDILEAVDFSGKKVALFGLGDQSTYSLSFVDGMGILYEWLKKKKVTIVGMVSREGYSFENSLALVKGKIAGLAIDEENEHPLTKERVAKWVELLKKEFK
jgi:flavodoxin I